jgi:Zn-dependent peptidase ImmA (M78 family)/predicted secreted protein
VSRRDVILEAADAANRELQRVNSERTVQSVGGGVDVFGAIISLDIPLLFRPLDNLLGAYVPQPHPGIIITTQRNLAVQRYTGAHELGHVVLGHSGSLDDVSILNRSPFGRDRYDDDREIAADAFAVNFLMPTWLFEVHAARQGWSAESFDDPRNVYQLSLRIGASYQATCRTLERYGIIERSTLSTHLSVAPKKIKQELLGEWQMPDWHSDVWVLTEQDEGTLIQGGPNDVFLIHLRENSGAGYLWNVEDLEKSGFALVSDTRHIPDVSESVGGAVERVLVAASQEEVAGRLELEQVRPWDPSDAPDRFTLKYELLGKENGRPRAQRNMSAAA